MRQLMVLAILAIVLAAAGPAYAHQPFFNDQGSPSIKEAYPIDEPRVSKAIFAAVRKTGTADYYQLDLPAGFLVDVQVMVPSARRCDPFRPSLALIGADIKAAGNADGLEIPAGMAARVFSVETWGSWQGHGIGPLHTGPAIRQRVRGGRYYLAVFHPPGATGEYLLSLGGLEQAGGERDARARIKAWEACPSGAAP